MREKGGQGGQVGQGGPALEVRQVWKRFRLRGRSLADLARDLVTRASPQHPREFWALEDVSFAVPAGLSFGVIGANGSGKSTLLKLMAGMMPPTRGVITTKGRVALLSHLGGGFHGDLTGRENVFLQGAILGLGRRELTRQLGDILAFAELEQFADMPVKFYSSGMMLRLGFSVAAHIEPEILFIDEALAVGDTAFRDRCLARLLEFRARGVTMVLVSHERYLVEQLCDRAVLLQHGRLIADGSPHEAFTAYERASEVEHPASGDLAVEGDPARAPLVLEQAELVGYPLGSVPVVETESPLTLRLHLRSTADTDGVVVGVQVAREWHVLHGTRTNRQGITLRARAGERLVLDLAYHTLGLARGTYAVHVLLFPHLLAQTPVVTWKRAARFRIQQAESEGVGLVRLPHQWRLVPPPA
jgi:ABC-type polysaccharide/polyol phosphate transport system ATPase subunit